jgi:copper resistance protein B
MTHAPAVRVASIIVVAVLGTAVPAFAQTDVHTGHRQGQSKPSGPPKPPTAGATEGATADTQTRELPPFIPPVTDEDRKAAFPDVEGHTVHDGTLSYFVLLDQLEWQVGHGANGVNIDSRGWVGRDRDRLWFRAEGDGENGRVDEAQTHMLYGRQFSRWWDVVAGVRQDFRPGPAQTWAALGVQGLAPYWFDIEATAYVGASGRTHARFEVEYELLLTNRLVLQPLLEAEVFGKSDPERGVGAGLSTTDLGFRLRYEFRREVAPYIGVTWNNKWGKTADFAEAAGEDTGGARFVTGLRLWF